jgi:calcium-dependent protein kinase
LNKDIDFKQLRDVFRSLDQQNTGILTVNEIKEAFKGSSMAQEDVDGIFNMIDFDHDGVINYSEFIAATMDK